VGEMSPLETAVFAMVGVSLSMFFLLMALGPAEEFECRRFADTTVKFDYPVEIIMCRTRPTENDAWSEWRATDVTSGTNEDIYMLSSELPE